MASRDLFDKCTAFRRHKDVQDLGLYPFFKPLTDSEGSRVVIEGRPRIMLGSNNYLGLTHHPEVIAAAHEALDRFGTAARAPGCSTVRWTCTSSWSTSSQLPRQGPCCCGAPAMSNSGSVGTWPTGDLIFADREDHASLIDGFVLSGAKLVRFKHNDMEDLERRLQQHADHQAESSSRWRGLQHDQRDRACGRAGPARQEVRGPSARGRGPRCRNPGPGRAGRCGPLWTARRGGPHLRHLLQDLCEHGRVPGRPAVRQGLPHAPQPADHVHRQLHPHGGCHGARGPAHPPAGAGARGPGPGQRRVDAKRARSHGL